MKKGFPKVLWLILILLLILGAAFGGTYLGNKYYEKEKAKEEEKETTKEKKTEVEKGEDKKPEEKKENEIEIAFETEEMELLSSKDKSKGFKHTRNFPTKIGIDAAAEKKILDYMKKVSDKEWDSIIKESKEMIDHFEKEGYPLEEGLGVDYSIVPGLVNKSVISFNFGISGTMGGATWADVLLYNFDAVTGDLLTLENVCLDVNTCKNTLFNYYMEELKRDERFNELESDYEANIKKNIYKVGGWGFTKDGLELVVGKYEIANGASGLFIYTIPYNKVNNLLVEKYRQ